jgi:DNA-directed RNA polymerase subunit omega
MARITIEDCVGENRIKDRFNLVMVAAQRAQQLLRGAPRLIDDEVVNKEVVTALREIAAGKVTLARRVEPEPEDWSSAEDESMPSLLDDELPPEA